MFCAAKDYVYQSAVLVDGSANLVEPVPTGMIILLFAIAKSIANLRKGQKL